MTIEIGFKYYVEDLLPYSTVRVSIADSNGKPKESGTGFFYRTYFDDRYSIDFIVTAKHLLEDINGKLKGEKTIFSFNLATRAVTNLQRKNKQIKLHKREVEIETTNWINLCDSNEDVYPNLTKDIVVQNPTKCEKWHEHPQLIDLAFIPLAPIQHKLYTENSTDVFKNSIYYNAIHPNDFIHGQFDSVLELNIRNLIFLGYPKNNWDVYNNLPIALSGIVSTPYNIDYENEPSFLINGNCIEGSSGSPVFIFERNTPFPKEDKNGRIILDEVGNHLIFIGILTETKKSQEGMHLNIGCVIRSRILDEIIEEWCIGKGYIERNCNNFEERIESLKNSSNNFRYHFDEPNKLIHWIMNSLLHKRISRLISDKQIGIENIIKINEMDALIEFLKNVDNIICNNIVNLMAYPFSTTKCETAQ